MLLAAVAATNCSISVQIPNFYVGTSIYGKIFRTTPERPCNISSDAVPHNYDCCTIIYSSHAFYPNRWPFASGPLFGIEVVFVFELWWED